MRVNFRVKTGVLQVIIVSRKYSKKLNFVKKSDSSIKKSYICNLNPVCYIYIIYTDEVGYVTALG